MSSMTLEQVRDWHRKQAYACGLSQSRQDEGMHHDLMADTIDAHLAQPRAVPDGWRASVKYAIEVLETEADIRENDDIGNKAMKRHTRLLKRMLAAAPSPGESA